MSNIKPFAYLLMRMTNKFFKSYLSILTDLFILKDFSRFIDITLHINNIVHVVTECSLNDNNDLFMLFEHRFIM